MGLLRTDYLLNTYTKGFLMGLILQLGLTIAFLIFLGIYVYFALAWSKIAEKLKYKRPWLAWIPIANVSMILQLGGLHWALVFLILIPLLGWFVLSILSIIATWKIFEKRNYPGWFSLSIIVPKVGFILYLIALGFVAWKDKKKK
ncbi:MAG: hypothetical protein QXF25_01085 [Candidatus Pacearchaeota archaeon]